MSRLFKSPSKALHRIGKKDGVVLAVCFCCDTLKAHKFLFEVEVHGVKGVPTEYTALTVTWKSPKIVETKASSVTDGEAHWNKDTKTNEYDEKSAKFSVKEAIKRGVKPLGHAIINLADYASFRGAHTDSLNLCDSRGEKYEADGRQLVCTIKSTWLKDYKGSHSARGSGDGSVVSDMTSFSFDDTSSLASEFDVDRLQEVEEDDDEIDGHTSSGVERDILPPPHTPTPVHFQTGGRGRRERSDTGALAPRVKPGLSVPPVATPGPKTTSEVSPRGIYARGDNKKAEQAFEEEVNMQEMQQKMMETLKEQVHTLESEMGDMKNMWEKEKASYEREIKMRTNQVKKLKERDRENDRNVDEGGEMAATIEELTRQLEEMKNVRQDGMGDSDKLKQVMEEKQKLSSDFDELMGQLITAKMGWAEAEAEKDRMELKLNEMKRLLIKAKKGNVGISKEYTALEVKYAQQSARLHDAESRILELATDD